MPITCTAWIGIYDKSPWAIDASDWIYLGMSHPIDLIRWYMGTIEEVSALGTRSSLAKSYGVENFDIYSANYLAQPMVVLGVRWATMACMNFPLPEMRLN